MNLNTFSDDIKELLAKHDVKSITASSDSDCYIKINEDGRVEIKGVIVNCEFGSTAINFDLRVEE